MKCIFCEIAEKPANCELLLEAEKVMSFLDINPVNYGHALVIPKNHYDNFMEVPAEELEGIISIVQKVASAIKRSINPDGINIIANNGKAAGQSVFHFHFHIIPRYNEDNFKFHLNLKKYSDGLIREYADKIRFEVNRQE